LRKEFSLSILFRAEKGLTVAQLAQAWASELPGAEGNVGRYEQDLVRLLVQDMVNCRFDNTGPLCDGGRLGLRIILPDCTVGFLEGDAIKGVMGAGGIEPYLLDRIVVTKEAVLDFASRRELPPPSWWTPAVEISIEPTNHIASFRTAPIPSATSHSQTIPHTQSRRGPKAWKRERVEEAMRSDIRQSATTLAELQNMLEKNLAARYGVCRDTARKAREAVVSDWSIDK
jgi:hypothetical protein